MKYEVVTLDKFTIVGIAVRTTNQEGKSQSDIGKLWESFFQKEVLKAIPNKLSEDIYCIYTDYESDYTGEYTTILGCQVSSIENVPADFIIKEIPECTYYKYISEGELVSAVGKTWSHIWKSDIDRKYLADFDIYGDEARDPKNARIITFLSVE